MTPYVKFSYIVLGSQRKTVDLQMDPINKKSDTLFKVSGYHLNIGIDYAIIPLIGALLEVEYQNQELTPDKVKLGGVDVSKGDKSTLTATNIQLGLRVGF